MSEVKFDRSRTAWISRGFEALAADTPDDPQSFDVLIVGSGYGGAIAADTLTTYQHGIGYVLDVVVLERGS